MKHETETDKIMNEETNRRRAYSVSDAAVKIGVHPETVRRFLRMGAIKGIKFGHWRVPADEVDRLLAGLPPEKPENGLSPINPYL